MTEIISEKGCGQSRGGDKTGSYSGYPFKVKVTVHGLGLDVGCERKRGINEYHTFKR